MTHLARQQLFTQRLMLACGVLLHVAWFGVMRQMSPHGVDSLAERVAISGMGAAALAASWVPGWRTSALRASWVFGYLVTAHAALLTARNPGDWAYALASGMTIAGFGVAIETIPAMVAFGLFSFGLELVATLSWPDGRQALVHVLGQGTILLAVVGGRVWRHLRTEELHLAVQSVADYQAAIFEQLPDIVALRDSEIGRAHV